MRLGGFLRFVLYIRIRDELWTVEDILYGEPTEGVFRIRSRVSHLTPLSSTGFTAVVT